MFIIISCLFLIVIFFLLAFYFDRLTAKSILDAQHEITKFQTKLTTNEEFAIQTFKANNVTKEGFSERYKAAITPPWIAKRPNTIVKSIKFLGPIELFAWDIIIGVLRIPLSVIIVPFLLSLLITLVCIIVYFTAEVHAFIALPQFMLSMGAKTVKPFIRSIRTRTILTEISWIIVTLGMFGGELDLYNIVAM